MKGMKKIIGAGIVAVLAVIAVYTFVAVKTENSSDKYSSGWHTDRRQTQRSERQSII